MEAACLKAFPKADVVVMAAAVSDFRFKETRATKAAKSEVGATLAVERTPDILALLGTKKKPGQLLVGFAAETHDVAAEARRKLREKGLDLIVANDVTAEGAGFGSDTNVVRLIDAAGLDTTLPVLPKEDVAGRILDWVAARRRAVRPQSSRARGPRRRSRRAPRPSA
jgi:phosphopantothenoylcysteine decarboxylase/phosphopantothenate--cysteine ligase